MRHVRQSKQQYYIMNPTNPSNTLLLGPHSHHPFLFSFVLYNLVSLWTTIIIVTATATPTSTNNATSTTSTPNILLLFADNLAYHDLGAFGSTTQRTPNIDRLTHQGTKFTHWNSAAHLCSASRAALLTGKYPVRTGVYPGVFHPDAKNGLLPQETTLAEYLKEHRGYATSIVGKWHLGHREEFLPTNQGYVSKSVYMSSSHILHYQTVSMKPSFCVCVFILKL